MIGNQTAFTTSYRYGSTDEEFVFACKGRPFAALISDILPTPDTNLIDHTLVRELGLKMTNLQCRKFHYAGNKMRILGRVSTAVQCIKDGRANGGFHLKGLVVTNLEQFLDTQVIVGTKMRGNIKKMSNNHCNERKRSTSDSDAYTESSDSDTSLESDSDDSVVSTQALEDLLLAPDSTTVSSSTMSSPTMSSTMSSGSTPTSVTMSSESTPTSVTMSSPVVSTSTSASFCSSITTTTATSSSTSAWVNYGSAALPSYKSELPIAPVKDPWASSYWTSVQAAEHNGRILDQCDRDGKPRITNIKDGRMLRVGIWHELEDPAGHEVRHVVLANLRKAAPDRVCQLCLYQLSHTCSLTDFGAMKHCQECCDMADQLHKEKMAKEYKEALNRM